MNKKIVAAWIILLIICIVCVLIFIVLKNTPHSAPVAQIYSHGELIRTVSLTDNCIFTVNSDNGYNTIRIADGGIEVIDADCPDKVCIHSGAIYSGAVPIICLPHRLEIRIVSTDTSIDAVIK